MGGGAVSGHTRGMLSVGCLSGGGVSQHTQTSLPVLTELSSLQALRVLGLLYLASNS